MSITIPIKILELIQTFLNNKQTGKLILNVKDGAILVVDVNESIRLVRGI